MNISYDRNLNGDNLRDRVDESRRFLASKRLDIQFVNELIICFITYKCHLSVCIKLDSFQ